MNDVSWFRRVAEPILLLIIVILMVLLCLYWSPCQYAVIGLWRLLMLLLLLFCIFAGHSVTGYWRGLLIDSRNMISLSRLQLVMWTILLLSALVVAALINICLGNSDPLNIKIDEQLYALMGISVVSLAGSSLIKTTKRTQKKNVEAEQDFRATVNDPAVPNVNATDTDSVPLPKTDIKGVLVTYTDPKHASWMDMFRGEESGNGAYLDIGKIQMFFFTLLIWFAYAMEVAKVLQAGLGKPGTNVDMPTLSQGMIVLLGISHAAYLTNKAVPQTPEPPSHPVPPPSVQPPPNKPQ